jgi:galactofuranosylgalactofuranosylrhamnosyl-N-acetylglucosaminyl-diphospho-decaprenol beta-1,5/1,6-galactofuranosyltransferase
MVNDHIPDNIFNTPEPSVYSGWWYCCIPLANIRSRGLPLPLFIRCDDMEYSWRHHRVHHITLNGVCIWHQAFNEGRSPAAVGLSERYFAPRNMFVRNALHIQGVEAKFPQYFWTWFKDCIVLYDYYCAELLLQAMQDILRGPEWLREDPEKTLARLKAVPKAPSCDSTEDRIAYSVNSRSQMGWKRRLLHKMTFGGMLLPLRLFSKAEETCPESSCWAAHFALRRRVRVVNEVSGRCSIREFDRWRSLTLGLRFVSLLWKMKRNYRRLCEEYRQAFHELTGLTFWEKYLQLDETQCEPSEQHPGSAAA